MHHLNALKLQDDVIVCHQMLVAVRHSSSFKAYNPSGIQWAWVQWGWNFREMGLARPGKQTDMKTYTIQSEQFSDAHKIHCSPSLSLYECLLTVYKAIGKLNFQAS